MIADSGNRSKFESGAVRDIQSGKGRCDLLPLVECANLIGDGVLMQLGHFVESGIPEYINYAIRVACKEFGYDEKNAILEVSVHFEEGANKYEERNWEKGIPAHCFLSSGIRHYLKHISGWTDERHDRAFIWNMLCLLWTVRNKPELNDLPNRKEQE